MEYKYEGNSLKSGIYKITNKLNGRVYIGSSKEFKRRWTQHAYSLKTQRHNNKFLQADFNKCGEDAFVFDVIEVTDGKTKEQRLLLEEIYIHQYYDKGKTCYNLSTKAVSPEGCGLKNAEETRKKHSESSKRFWAEASQEQKKLLALKVSDARKKYLSTPEGRLKNAKNGFQKGNNASGKGERHRNAIKVHQIDLETRAIVATYNSVKEAIQKAGTSPSAMFQMLAGKKKNLQGYVWVRTSEDLNVDQHLNHLAKLHEEKRLNASIKQSDRLKKYWIDQNLIQKQREITAAYWANMSPSKKEQLRSKLSISATNRLTNPEDRLKNAKNGFQKGYNGTGKGKDHHGAQPIAQIDIESGDIVKTYDCIEDAIKQSNVSKAEIYRVLRGVKKSTKGFGWIRLNKNHYTDNLGD